MATISVRVEGIKELQAQLKRMGLIGIPRKFYETAALKIQENAADKQIAHGGRGKGKALKALPHRLTSRHGGAGLVGSIRINRGPLPRAIEIGTDKAYGAVHEFGLSVGVPSHFVAAHKRTVAFGRKVAPFEVPAHFRSGHHADYPKRPFLAPALKAISPKFPDILIREWKKEAKL